MPQYWKEYSDELTRSHSQIQEALNATADEKIRVRLERLRNETDHVRCFLGC
jgi:hypothetical protein